MDREQAIRILNREGSSKADLRQALAFALGVNAPAEKKSAKSANPHEECRRIFLDAYLKYAGFPYQYKYGKDGAALKGVIHSIYDVNASDDYDLTVAFFRSLVEHLPEWYRIHKFSPAGIWGNFSEILVEERSHVKKDKGVTDDYLRRKLDIINAKG